MDHHNFSRGNQNRNVQGSGGGGGQIPHHLLSMNGSFLANDHVHTLESLAAMERLFAQQAARQMVENNTGFDQFNVNAGIDLGALRRQSTLAQLQAQANQEAVASELAMRLAKQSRAEEAMALADSHQRHQLLQQHALLSQQQHQQQQQQQRQLEALQRASAQYNQNVAFQENPEQGNRELHHLHEEVQLLELLRVRQDLILQRHKQEDGLKVASVNNIATQQAQHQSNLLASFNDLDRLQALRQLNLAQANGVNNAALANGSQGILPMTTSSALGVLGQRDLNEINMLYQHHQNQQRQKAIASAQITSNPNVNIQNNGNHSRDANGVPIIPKNSRDDKPISPQSIENAIIPQGSISASKLIERANAPKAKKKPKITKKAIPDLQNGRSSSVNITTNPNAPPSQILTNEVNIVESRNVGKQKETVNVPNSIQTNLVKQSQATRDVPNQQVPKNSTGTVKEVTGQVRRNNKNGDKRVVPLSNSDNSKANLPAMEAPREQQLRFFNNGVETHMDGSPMVTKTLPKSETKKTQVVPPNQNPYQESVEALKRKGTPKSRSRPQDNIQNKSPANSPPFHSGENGNLKTGYSKSSSLLPKPVHVKKTVANSRVLPFSSNKPSTLGQPHKEKKVVKQHPASVSSGQRNRIPQFSTSETSNQPNSISNKGTLHDDATKNNSRDASSSMTINNNQNDNFSRAPNPRAPHVVSNSDYDSKTSTPETSMNETQSVVVPKVNKHKKANSQTGNGVIKKRKICKNPSQPQAIPTVTDKNVGSSNQPVEVSAHAESVDTNKSSVLAQKCTRAEFFTFVIERVPELAPSVAIIQSRFKGDDESFVPIQAVNLILAELYYLAKMDGANHSNNKKLGKSLPLLREKSNLRINTCITQIETYKNAFIENYENGGKKISKNSPNGVAGPNAQTHIPKPTGPSLVEKYVEQRSHKVSGKSLKQSKPWKPTLQSTETQTHLKQTWNNLNKSDAESLPREQPANHSSSAHLSQTNQNVGSSKASGASTGPHSDLMGEIFQKEKDDENSVKDCKIELNALNAARALLNFGAK